MSSFSENYPTSIDVPSLANVYKLEEKPPLELEVCQQTADPELILKARQLTARSYLAREFITPDQVDADGGIKSDYDPHKDNSDYYVLRRPEDGELIATLRKINYDDAKDERSFPLLEHKSELYPEYVEQLETIGIENVVEISALVKEPKLDTDGTAALKLYRQIFLDAWSQGKEKESAFIMACNPKLFRNFKMIFDGSMKRIGPDLHYPGQDAIPAMFVLREGAVDLITNVTNPKNRFSEVHKIVIDYFLTGADAKTLDPSILEALEQAGMYGVLAKMKNSGYEQHAKTNEKTLKNLPLEVTKAKALEALDRRKPEMYAAAGLVGYTALRTAGVGFGLSPHSAVDWRVFLGIELATTPTYVLGMGDMARSVLKPESYSTRRKLGAAALAGSSLVAPYAYVVAEGQGIPSAAWAGVGAFGVVSIFSAASKFIKARRSRPSQSKE